MSRSRQIAINAVSQWGITGISSAVGLILVPFLIRHLGKDGYGLIALTVSIASVCALADLGISGALGRQLAEALAQKEEERYSELLSTAAVIHAVLGCLSGLAVVALAPRLAVGLGITNSAFHTAVQLLRTYGGGHVACTFLFSTPEAVLAGHNRFDRANQLLGLRKIVEACGIFLVFRSPDAGVIAWGWVCLAGDVACVCGLWWFARRVHGSAALSRSRVNWGRGRELLGLGAEIAVLQVAGQLGVNTDPFILAACLGPWSLSLYRPPSQILGTVSPIVMTVANQMHPLATKAHVEGAKADLEAILCYGTKYTVLLGGVFCGLVISLADPLCHLWLGRALGAQYKVCAAVLVVQAITYLGAFAAGTQWSVLLGMKRTAFAAYGRLALAIVNVAASWLLVRHTALGVLGVVIPTMAIELLWRPILTWHVCHISGLDWWAYFKKAYGAALLVDVGTVIAGAAAYRIARPDTMSGLGALAAGLLALAGVACWVGALDSWERTRVKHAVACVLGDLRLFASQQS